MRIVLALAALLAGTAAAEAYCPTVPDDARSHYVGNSVRHSICLNEELGYSTEYKNFETETRSHLEQLQREMVKQRFETPGITFNSPFYRTFP